MELRQALRTRMGKRVAALAAAAAIACCMAPGIALAADLAASPASDSAPLAATANQEKMVKVRVVKSMTETVPGIHVATTKYTVNKDGLLVEAATKSKSRDITTEYTNTWKYDKKGNLKSSKFADRFGVDKTTYKTTKKGVLKSDSYKGGTDSNSYTTKYQATAGRITALTRNAKYSGTTKLKLGYKNGKLIAVKNLTYPSLPATQYAYDSKGNLSKMISHKGTRAVPITYKSTYKKGLLKKRVSIVSTANSVNTTTTWTYKTVKVPKSMVKKVKAQQWALLNNNLNFATGSWKAV